MGSATSPTPGSAYLFPGLCAPTDVVKVIDLDAGPPRGDRSAMMPRRTQPRATQRAADIACERAHNHQLRATIRTPAIDDYEHQYKVNYGLPHQPDEPPF